MITVLFALGLPALRLSLPGHQSGGAAPDLPVLLGVKGPPTAAGWLKRAVRLYGRAEAALGQIADNAHDEALYLILRTLGLPLDSEAGVLARRLTAAEGRRSQPVFKRRLVERVPAAYLTREAWLGGCRFYVDERALIPRSYFVELIGEPIDAWLPNPPAVRRVADVCTGSGCLAILLARHYRGARVDAIDVSAEALEVAEINVRRHRVGDRVRLRRGDVFDSAPPARYDVIVSNPPYEPAARVDALPEEFRREPRLALDGGADGMAVIRKLIRQARTRLGPPRRSPDRGGRTARPDRPRICGAGAALAAHGGRGGLRVA